MKIMTTRQAASFLGVSKDSLVRYRKLGVGPDYAKLGKLVRYTQEDLEGWVTRHRRDVDGSLQAGQHLVGAV